MSTPRITVVGSSNVDIVVKADHIPRPGETVIGGDFVMVPGGKGANQAVCAAKLGADVTLVARVGDDAFGRMSLENFEKSGVRTDYVIVDREHPSGIALIAVDSRGENAIVVAPGANHALSPADVDKAKSAIAESSVLVVQLEIPAETVQRAIELAKSLGIRVILNPAPIRPLSRELLAQVDVLVPNEHEAAYLVGEDSSEHLDPKRAARQLRELGVANVIITLGSAGVLVATDSAESLIEAFKVEAVDTTAAGDAFTGALACAIAEGSAIMEAAKFAAKVAAISVTRMGAQTSMPSREEVNNWSF
ncbi:MAG: ribokinase [Armatimonadota bacterium]|nr:ribokinase [Armatimonadota bacterium]